MPVPASTEAEPRPNEDEDENKSSKPLTNDAARRHPLVLPLVVGYAALVFALSALRHHNFGSTSDLGTYHAVYWNFAHNGSLWNSIDRMHHWAGHIEIGLLWLWLPYKIHASPLWLFLIQSLSSACAALPIEALTRRATGDKLTGLAAAMAMLLLPQFLLGTLGDFHPTALCALPMAILAYGIERDSRRTILLGAVLALSLREHMGLAIAAASAAWIVRHGRRRLVSATLLAIFGLGTFVIAHKLLIPSFGSGQSFRYMAQYQRLGGSADKAIDIALSDPIRFLSMAFDGPRMLYLLALLSGGLPLLLLAFRAPRRAAWPLLIAAPLVAVQIYSDNPLRWDITSPYGVPAVPFLVTAAALALSTIPERGRIPLDLEDEWLKRPLPLRQLAAGAWVGLVVAHLSQVVPSPVGPGKPVDPTLASSGRANALRRALSLIPRDASVSAQDSIVPHVAARSEVHLYPDGERTDDFVFLDVHGPARNYRDRDALERAADHLRGYHRRFEVLVDEAGVLLVRRKPDAP